MTVDGGPSTYLPGAGIYTYKASFRINSRTVNCARLAITSMGADNRVLYVYVNGHYYGFNSLPYGNHYNPLIGAMTITLDPLHLNASGLNDIVFTVRNSETYLGFNLCANIELGPQNILPNLSGPASFCPGVPLSFTASLSPGSGPTSHYLWALEESDAAGNLIPGGFTWELWHTGTPGAFTFPSNLNQPCNKYYRVRLAAVRDVGDNCLGWSEKIHVIYYSCNPTINAGPDRSVCPGTYAFIGFLFPPAGMTYAWRIGSGPVFATTSGQFVSPATTTTYTLTGTNAYGCSASDQVTVTVQPNNPNFNIAANSSNPGYFTLTATPVVTNANTQPGFGEAYSIEGLDATGNTTFSVNNPSIWWIYPNANTFKGFDHISNNYNTAINSLPSAPAQGRFRYDQKYRITRGTWNDNCEWNAFSYDITPQENGLGQYVIQISESSSPQSSSSRLAALTREEQSAAEAISIFPNPTTGQLNISLDTDQDAQVDVFDLFGKKIQSRNIAAGTRTLQIDLSGYAKGMYLIHVSKGGETSTHKVILQ